MKINWHEHEWFSKHHAHKVTPEFETWWIGYYGKPKSYLDESEYFIRASFALAGWLAQEHLCSNNKHNT